MKKIVHTVCAVAAMGSLGFAGGDMKNVEPAVEPVVVVPVAEEGKSGMYVGLGLSAVSTRESSLDFFSVTDGQDRTGNLLFMAGYEFNPYVAAEGRYSTYIAEGDVLNSDIWGVYLKPQYPVNEDFKLYALLGFGGMDVEPSNGYAMDVDDSGFQWGLGASYGVTKDISLFADYISVASAMESNAWYLGGTPDVDADTFTVGAIYNF